MKEQKTELKVVWVCIAITAAWIFGIDFEQLSNIFGLADYSEQLSAISSIRDRGIKGLVLVAMNVLGIFYSNNRTKLKISINNKEQE